MCILIKSYNKNLKAKTEPCPGCCVNCIFHEFSIFWVAWVHCWCWQLYVYCARENLQKIHPHDSSPTVQACYLWILVSSGTHFAFQETNTHSSVCCYGWLTITVLLVVVLPFWIASPLDKYEKKITLSMFVCFWINM